MMTLKIKKKNEKIIGISKKGAQTPFLNSISFMNHF